MSSSYSGFLSGLNMQSPTISPTNALVTQTDSMSLSHGVSPDELQQQLNGLNAWANVPFQFDDSWPSLPDDSALYLSSMDESQILDGSSMGLYINPDPFVMPPLGSTTSPDINTPQSHSIVSPDNTSTSGTSTFVSATAAKPSAAYKRGTPGRKPKNRAPAAPLTEAEKKEEELNQIAREDDKRRRNTAASARFRVRKKEREAALEASAKTLQTKVIELEKEVEALKTENSWLRELIVQKSRGGDTSTIPAQKE